MRIYRLISPTLLQGPEGEIHLSEKGPKAQTPWGEDRFRRKWSLGEPLGSCLGDPMALPPAGDPGAFRHLELQGEKASWVLDLPGLNRCGLGGRLTLDARADRLDLGELRCGELPWLEGGREHCRALLQAELRARLPGEWATLDAASRIAALEALVQDPDPQALEALHALLRDDPASAPDIEAAIERRPKAGPVDAGRRRE